MIADLPPKRVTRRLVFETPNGNNQATINSVSIILSFINISLEICNTLRGFSLVYQYLLNNF